MQYLFWPLLNLFPWTAGGVIFLHCCFSSGNWNAFRPRHITEFYLSNHNFAFISVSLKIIWLGWVDSLAVGKVLVLPLPFLSLFPSSSPSRSPSHSHPPSLLLPSLPTPSISSISLSLTLLFSLLPPCLCTDNKTTISRICVRYGEREGKGEFIQMCAMLPYVMTMYASVFCVCLLCVCVC